MAPLHVPQALTPFMQVILKLLSNFVTDDHYLTWFVLHLRLVMAPVLLFSLNTGMLLPPAFILRAWIMNCSVTTRIAITILWAIGVVVFWSSYWLPARLLLGGEAHSLREAWIANSAILTGLGLQPDRFTWVANVASSGATRRVDL